MLKVLQVYLLNINKKLMSATQKIIFLFLWLKVAVKKTQVYLGNCWYIVEIIIAGHCFDILLPREHRVAPDAVTMSRGL